MRTLQKQRAVLGLILTLVLLHFVPNRPLVVVLLLVAWGLVFAPLSAGELVLFVFASLFFLGQDYVTLKAGLFEFTHKDILLMPYYEPFLWGFYFLSLKRFVSGTHKDSVVVDKRSVAGVVVTSMVFSLFSYDSGVLFIATLCSTLLLFALFHTKTDLQYAGCALVLGFIIEMFGVSTGVWSYPAPDFLGIPYWFATMWMSVGLLGRRFLIPASGWLATRVWRQRA